MTYLQSVIFKRCDTCNEVIAVGNPDVSLKHPIPGYETAYADSCTTCAPCLFKGTEDDPDLPKAMELWNRQREKTWSWFLKCSACAG